jgi:hypothetical protein
MAVRLCLAAIAAALLPCALPAGALADDVTPPHIDSITATPATVDVSGGPAQLTVSAHLTDDHALDGTDEFVRLHPRGFADTIVEHMRLVSGTTSDGVWEATFTLPSDAILGDYDVVVHAEDTSTNTVESLADAPMRVVGKRDIAQPKLAEAPTAPVGSTVPETAKPASVAVRRSTTGLTVGTSCGSACSVRSELRLGKTVLARGSQRLRAAGPATVRLKLSSKARRRARRARSLSLRTVITDAAGHQRVVTRKVTLH